MNAKAILESVLYAEDLKSTEKFYTEVLGLEIYSKDSYHIFFKLEHSMLLIFDKEHTKQQDTLPQHGTESYGHLAFAMLESEIQKWKSHLNKLQVKIEKELRWENGAYSIYFRDPAGNSIELVTPDLWEFNYYSGSTSLIK
ncbi:MAG: VOC family protein [Flavobacteriales bacterium]|nr:VOC family protein [Flavobacteriales bacterium]